jgi:hypothetical protein
MRAMGAELCLVDESDSRSGYLISRLRMVR